MIIAIVAYCISLLYAWLAMANIKIKLEWQNSPEEVGTSNPGIFN